MAATAILKIAFLAITHREWLSDFGEILCEEAERHADNGHMTITANFLKSKMADRRHFENRYIAISLKNLLKIFRF